ncbi:uncharacterized protein C15orf65 homolog [Thamnophis elegans]|uniref:uncharacterized protein C15orf65 homolog n=1 Tax=Thamnophis elegans TaxID=35005 RepID=UPI0013786522|nr:uncharacterized protein C15orf65 homolog [Thamnophis elegans]
MASGREGPRSLPAANPGNPIFTCLADARTLVTGTRLSAAVPLLYKTTASDYGALRPTSATAPCRFCPLDSAFTARLAAAGPPQHNGINTGTDRSPV